MPGPDAVIAAQRGPSDWPWCVPARDHTNMMALIKAFACYEYMKRNALLVETISFERQTAPSKGTSQRHAGLRERRGDAAGNGSLWRKRF